MAKVLIVGAGAAGLMAAGAAVRQGHQVTVLEHTDKPGQKILVTGKGRCNVTNVADIDDFFKQIPRNPRFLNAAARQFTHEDVTGLLEMLGTPTKVERGGRVFGVRSGQQPDRLHGGLVEGHLLAEGFAAPSVGQDGDRPDRRRRSDPHRVGAEG